MEKEPFQIENSKSSFIKELYELKDEYKGGKPDEMKHSTMPEQNWKIRNAWFSMLIISLHRINNAIALPDELKNEIEVFKKRMIDDEKKLNTLEDIEMADDIINKVLAELEK